MSTSFGWEHCSLLYTRRLVAGVCVAGALLAGCEPTRPPSESHASDSAVASDTGQGTGTFYMGREIAPVTGHSEWMNRPNREETELPQRVVRAMSLSPTDKVADVGAGAGYFTLRLAPEVPYGKVYAVDIQPALLDTIRQRAQERGFDNVVPVRGTRKNPRLPDSTLDAVLMVDAYHEFSHPHAMMEHIVEALRPGGRVYLVEYRGEDPTLPVSSLHAMTEEQARKEMRAVGLRWSETLDVLPQQHLMVFRKPFE